VFYNISLKTRCPNEGLNVRLDVEWGVLPSGN
jgi:hypothetical protein